MATDVNASGYQPVPGSNQTYDYTNPPEAYPPTNQPPAQGFPQMTGYQQPPAAGYQQPGYQQPPPMGQPVYQQPGYQQPGYQQPGYQQPAFQQTSQVTQISQVNGQMQMNQVTNMNGQVTILQTSQGRGAGPYPGETCCGCFEIKCGMQVLAAIGILQCIGLPFSFLNYLFHPYGSDARLMIFCFIGTILMLPNIYAGIIFGRWLVSDQPETRAKLPKAFMMYMITWTLMTFWQIIGSLICLGSLYPIYLIKKFPYYVDASVSGYYNNISQYEATLTAAFIARFLVMFVVALALNYYYMGCAKRLISLW